ncbi:MAG: hypothetical protein IPP83_07550 [Flavobacteriales bacterium]|nr:hypothetical protein [Flavobacteriales bacterium]
MWLLVLLFLYAFLFVIVVWPIHWIWHSRTQQGPYDPRFYSQPSFWRIYAWVFGCALIASLLANILQQVW